MSVYVRANRQTFTGDVIARGRLKTLVRYETVFPASERVDWFWRWRVHAPDNPLGYREGPKRYRCFHVRPPCRCGRVG